MESKLEDGDSGSFTTSKTSQDLGGCPGLGLQARGWPE